VVAVRNFDWQRKHHGQGDRAYKNHNVVSQTQRNAHQRADDCQLKGHCTLQRPRLGTPTLARVACQQPIIRRLAEPVEADFIALAIVENVMLPPPIRLKDIKGTEAQIL
jgi:hypothetical protein